MATKAFLLTLTLTLTLTLSLMEGLSEPICRLGREE